MTAVVEPVTAPPRPTLGSLGRRHAPRARRRPAATPEVLLVGAGVIGAGLTAAWWWATTGPVTTWGQAVTAAGRLTGLTAGVAMIGLVTLAARIGPLDRAIGPERLYLWHGRLGRYALSLVAAHVVLITAGYALVDRTGPGAVVASFLADAPLVLSLVAVGLLIVVGLVSAQALRRRLPYEVWHALHLATYAAIILGSVHQVTSGQQFAGHPVASTLWLLAYLVPTAALVANRLVRPAVSNARHRFFVAEITPEAPGVFSVTIGGIGLDRIPVRPGQFVRVHAAARGLRFASNPYSLSAVPRGGCWRITVAAVGEQSRRLVSLPPHTRLWLEGPMGHLTLDPRSDRPVLLVAGGLGVPPLRALAEAALVERPQAPVTLLYRLRDEAPQLFADEWAALAAWANGRLAVHVRRGLPDTPGNSLDAASLRAVAPWLGQADVYACGPVSLTDAVVKAARAAGAPTVRVESFGWSPGVDLDHVPSEERRISAGRTPVGRNSVPTPTPGAPS